ncbi:hypothetical protein [Rhizobium sp. PP-CC-3G-465]|uniref:hypothetical protein n=1 Tax=Rhizobium sp. PP-CC-3G-465 TaxID=2135648 RepID=UPI00104F67BE|nr:hypothetical protein C8J33_101909 [Rhizobium sp. PP-CC-3G-465]
MATVNALRIGGDAFPSKGYPPLSVFKVPVVSGLTGCFVFSGGPKIALTNWAGGPDATLYGALEDHDGYCTVVDVIDTHIPETPAMTFFALFRTIVGPGNSGVMGTFAGGENEGISLFAYSGSPLLNALVEKAGGADTINVNMEHGVWTIASLTSPATGATVERNHTLGTQATSTNTGASKTTGSEKVHIGGLPVVFRAPIDLALAVIFNRALTTGETTAMEAWAREHAEAFGLEA